MTFLENISQIDILLIIAGILIGSILGAIYGYTRENNQKQKTLGIFGAIIVAVIGGGLYFYLDQLEIFTVFTISDAIGFIVTALIARAIYGKRHSPTFGIIPIRYDPNVEKWNKEYGPGFRRDDVLIVEAINKGKTKNEEIATYCNFNKKYVKQRVGFMIKKGLLK